MLTDPDLGRAREVRDANTAFQDARAALQDVSDKLGRGEASLKEFDAARAVLGRCQANLVDLRRGTAGAQ
jgi:hypothetical protein